MKKTFASAAMLSALCFAPSAFAAGPLVVQASAGISNLQLNVSDFRPKDKIVAEAILISGGNGKLSTTCCEYYIDHSAPYFSSTGTERKAIEFLEGALINAEPKGVALQYAGSGTAQRTPDGLQVDMTIDQTGFESVHIHHGRWSAATIYATASASIDSFQLRLTPGTEIQLSGVTTVDAFVDMTQQKTQGANDIAVLTEVHAETSMSVSAENGKKGIEFLVQPSGPEAFAGGDVSQVKYKGEVFSKNPTQLHESRSFNYVIRNNGSKDQVLTIGFGAKVWARGDHGGASLVPEPSTWALMLSGLALAGLSARRRQAA